MKLPVQENQLSAYFSVPSHIIVPSVKEQKQLSIFMLYEYLLPELKHEIVSYLFLEVSTQERKEQAIKKFLKMPIDDALKRYTTFKNRKSFKPYLTNLSVLYQKKMLGQVYLSNLGDSFHPLEFFIFSDKELACAGKNGTFSLDDLSHMKSIQNKGMGMNGKDTITVNITVKEIEEFLGYKKSDDYSVSDLFIGKQMMLIKNALLLYDYFYQHQNVLNTCSKCLLQHEYGKIKNELLVVKKILNRKTLSFSDMHHLASLKKAGIIPKDKKINYPVYDFFNSEILFSVIQCGAPLVARKYYLTYKDLELQDNKRINAFTRKFNNFLCSSNDAEIIAQCKDLLSEQIAYRKFSSSLFPLALIKLIEIEFGRAIKGSMFFFLFLFLGVVGDVILDYCQLSDISTYFALWEQFIFYGSFAWHATLLVYYLYQKRHITVRNASFGEYCTKFGI